MGTKVQCKSSLPGFYPMRELNNDSNSHSWHLYYGERSFTNAQYHKVVLPRASANGYLGDDKDVVKQKMLEHEAIFKNQVFELHRLYRRQRDLMDKIKSTELSRNRLHVDSLLSSSALTSQVTSEDASRRNLPCFPKANSSTARFSISGVEEGHSSLNSIKGNSQMPYFFPPQSESTVKDLQVLESRPTKFRRKMLDLQLPADEYIDSEDGEQFHDGNVADTLSHNHITDQKIDLERDVKLYADDIEQTGCLQNARKLGACLEKNTSCLTDLNEPIQLVETNASTYVDPLSSASCHGETQCPYPSSGPKSCPINLQRKDSLNTDNGSDNMTGNNLNFDKNTSRGGILPHFLESGHSYNSKNSFSHGLQTKVWPVSSEPMESFFNEIHEAPPSRSTDKGRAEQSREGQVFGLQFTKRSPEIKGEPLCSFVPSHTSTLHPAAPDLSKSWSNSNSSWESASTNFQKLTTAQAQQCMNSVATMNKNFHSPFHGMESSGERWLLSNDSQLNKGSNSELSYFNRAFLGSSSEYKEEVGHPSSGTHIYQIQGKGNSQAPKDLSPSMSLKLLKDSNHIDMKGPKERNFNMVFSNNSTGQAEPAVGENCKLLPWLRSTTGGNTETTNSERFSSAEEFIYVRSSISSLPDKNSHSTRNDIFNKEFESDSSSKSQKLLKISTCEELQDPKKEMSSLVRPLVPCETKESRECRVLDINLPCDPLVSESDNLHSEKLNEAKACSFGLIDLNLSLSDDEESFRPTPKSTVRMWGEIDLEAPATSVTEDIVPAEEIIETMHELSSKPHCKDINQEDELMELAAEAMVSISSSICHISLEDATCSAAQDCTDNLLNLLVEMAFLCSDGYESESLAALRAKPSNELESSLEGMDTFESMTLGLIETKAEEYMPKSLVPGHTTMEEKAINLLQNRPRRGQARRGRQRRDFQRDILPGLASLSRQEVTEDLNTFGGLMRAMGHVWTSGLAKRNSSRNVASGKGRRRSVISPSPQPTENLPLLPQPSNTEMGLDKRSLTGWGKTTRRPRRQRVPAGNLAAIALV
ncbi:uncharacterized protein LOC120076785 isoform X2 [Benincasa hispida]|uniref:uncharacterized protein LOC120076785 isoform X2 n=1 Tax=Benincasa hispida TaxID=102211 RepID=UPI00190236F5|nr:uncharacterized protein LOC120076785 isoform X2 [Benincasa hispida]